MLEQVKQTIEKYNMLKKGERVLVGLSGGADSVTLLLCLKSLEYDVRAVHVNHNLRGGESDRDEQFCVNLCEKEKIPLVVKSVDVKKLSNEKGFSLELAARELRYQAFCEVCRELETTKIATAHNLNDCMETSILNLTRGAGICGVCGIPPVRDSIVRPLIECSREQIEEYLAEQNVDYVTDSTNLVADCSRNKIRLEVMPVLKGINSGVEKSFRKTAENLRETEAFLKKLTDDAFKNAQTADNIFDCGVLCSFEPLIAKRVIARALSELDAEISSDKINAVLQLCYDGGKLELSSTLFATAEKSRLTLGEITENEKVLYSENLELSKQYCLHGKTLIVTRITFSADEYNVHKKFTKSVIDYDKITGMAVVRNRREGDRIKLCGRGFTSSVKKLFNADVPRDKRDSVLIISDDEGPVFVEGYGIAQRVMVSDSTKNAVEIMVSEIS